MVRQHGSWREHIRKKDESHLTTSPVVSYLYQPLNSGNAVTTFDRSGFEARHIMSVSGHRSESSLKSYCKTGQNTKEKMADSLMSVIARSSTSGSNTRLGENEVPSSLLLTDSQEDFLLRDLTVQTANNNNAKQFNFFNCKVDFHYTYYCSLHILKILSNER